MARVVLLNVRSLTKSATAALILQGINFLKGGCKQFCVPGINVPFYLFVFAHQMRYFLRFIGINLVLEKGGLGLKFVQHQLCQLFVRTKFIFTEPIFATTRI